VRIAVPLSQKLALVAVLWIVGVVLFDGVESTTGTVLIVIGGLALLLSGLLTLVRR